MSLLGDLLGLGGAQAMPAAAAGPASGVAQPEGWLLDLLGGVMTQTGLRVSVEDALSVPGIAACVQVLSEDLAKVPLLLYRRDGDGRARARDHRLYRLVKERPAPWLTSFTWRRIWIAEALVRGTGFCRVRRDLSGRVERIQPLARGRVTPRWSEDGEPFFDVAASGRGMEKGLSWEDVLALPYRATTRGASNGGVTGESPLSSHREAIALAIATERFAAKFFANGARPSFVVEMDGRLPSDEVGQRLRRQLTDLWTGIDNAYKVAILELGMKLKEVAHSNDNSQLVEIRELQAEEMARLYRVPPHKIGILKRATFSNIEHQAIEYVTDTLAPLAAAVEQLLSACLLTEAEQQEYFFEHNLDALLRGDLNSRYRAYALGRQWGWLNVDEVRRLENMNPLRGGLGQTYLEPMNMVPAGTDREAGRDEDDEGERRRDRGAIGLLPATLRSTEGADHHA